MRTHRTLLAPTIAALLLLSPALAAAQSTSIVDYVLLARTSLRAKALTVLSGDVGVTTGSLVTRNQLDAPTSDLAGPVVKMDKKSDCATLYADSAMGTGPNCGPAQDFTSPFADLAAACEFPTPFPACNPGAPVVVLNGSTTTLPPGVYGDVQVSGGSGGPAILELNGTYSFCSVRVARNGIVRFAGPSTVNVKDSVLLSTSADWLPASPAVAAQDIKVFVDGRSVRFSRLAKVGAVVCAPQGRISFGSGATLEGRFVADAIRTKQNKVATSGMPPETTTTTVAPTTTTTTTSSTTTTIPAAVCGNGILEVGEECDTNQFGNATCPGSSVAGAFLTCTGSCTIDFSGCPSVTTTTTTPSTTTTTGSEPTTTTTTLPVETTTTTTQPVETTTTTTITPPSTTTTTLAAVCGNGVLEPGEQCDTNDFGTATCPGSSVAGAFLTCTAGCTIDFSGCPGATTTTTQPEPTTTTTTQPVETTTTTTTTSSTTTTTLGAVCGNGVLEPGEECDTNQFGNATCPGSSVAGAFLTCTGSCTIDFSGCPGATTTTTTLPVETTTTTTTTPTTTTTTIPATCGNGVIDAGEECDTTQFGNATCPGSSVAGAFLTCNANCTIDFSGCPGASTTTTTTAPSTTTTTTVTPSTSTTTTTLPGSCGNGEIDPGEECDDGNTEACDGCSATCQIEEVGNGVVECEEECDDGNTVDCDGCSSTGTIEGCGNNVAECDEVCDGTDLNGNTCPGSPSGALLCNEDCSGVDTSQCGTPQVTEEDCTNCVDDNGDGLVDYEDPQCCSAPNAFISSVRRGNLKPRKNGRSFLRLREVLDSSGGLQLKPMAEQVTLQIRQGENELLCARVPAGKFMKMGKWWKFWAKKSAKNAIIKGEAQGIEDMAIRIKKNGTVRYKAYGRHVNLATPGAGNLEITVGFTNPSVGNSSNRCSRVLQPFSAKGTKGALKAP